MLAKILLGFFLVCSLFFLYLCWEEGDQYVWYLVASFVMVPVIYMLEPQINWWWYQRRPPDLPDKLRHLVNTQLPFYQELSVENKTRFRQRMALFMEANEFMPQGMEAVPPDLKAVVAASAVQLTFGLEKYLFPKFENVVIYPHPFPSPQYPEHWHASEIYPEDGVVIFSAEQLMAGFLQPQRYFHIGLYEYARIFATSHPEVVFPTFKEADWEKLERISGFSQDFIEKWIGLPGVDIQAVAIAHFFIFPEKFKAELPAVFHLLSGIFHQRQFA
jgi:hypothetical protein